MRRFRLLRETRGSALVEFAIALPVLLLLVFGIVDFGRALFALNNLTNAVREGARLASVQFPDPTTGAAISAVRTRVNNYVSSFGGSGAYTVNVTPDQAFPNTQYMTVQITGYAFTPITPLPRLMSLPAITFSPSASYRWEGAQ